MILITGGAGFIGSNLQAALVRRGHETVVADTLGSAGKWRNLAKHPPARDRATRSDLDQFLDKPPTGRDGVSSRCGQRNDGGGRRPYLGDQRRTQPAAVGMVFADRGVRMVYASSGGDLRRPARRGFSTMISALSALWNGCGPLNLYGWTKHAFDMLVAKDADTRGASNRRSGPA